jgi:hypothetical protein
MRRPEGRVTFLGGGNRLSDRQRFTCPTDLIEQLCDEVAGR